MVSACPLMDLISLPALASQILISPSQYFFSLFHLPVEEIDNQIERGLQQIVAFLEIDRGILCQLAGSGNGLFVTHSYTSAGFAPFPSVDLATIVPWYTARIRDGQVLRFSRLPDELPPEAAAEREYCLRGGFRSHVVLPFTVGKSILGPIQNGLIQYYAAVTALSVVALLLALLFLV